MTHRTNDPKAKSPLELHMERVAIGALPTNELRLDPANGELVLVPRGSGGPVVSSDGVVIDQIAEDGFFSGSPSSRRAPRSSAGLVGD